MNKLPKDIKERWVAALRSGKYKQGQDYLCRGDEYCCLGVLQMELDGTTIPGNNDDQLPSMQWAYEHGLSDDPVMVMNWNPTVEIGADDHEDLFYGETTLAELNDSGAYSFNQIADLIEEQL